MTNLSRYGAGLLGDFGDLAAPDLERFADNDWHARVTVNLRNGVAYYRPILEAACERGVSLLPILFWTGDDGKACAPGHPEWDQARWQGFCRDFSDLLAQVPGSPEQVEVWNEPNTMAFWPGSARSAGRYVDGMLAPAAAQFPSRVAIVCAGLSFREWFTAEGEYRARKAESWLGDFVRNDGHRLVQRWSIHPYGRTNADGSRCRDANINAFRAVEEVRRFKRKINELSAGRPAVRMAIWITETGLSTHHADFDEVDQRRFLSAFVTGVAQAGGLGVRAWSNWPLRDPFPPAPNVYYSGLYERGDDFIGTNAPLKLGGDYWRELST